MSILNSTIRNYNRTPKLLGAVFVVVLVGVGGYSYALWSNNKVETAHAQGLPSCTETTVNGFTHPGMLSNCADLDFMRSKLSAGEQPWANGYTKVGASIDIIRNDAITGSTGSNPGLVKNHQPNPVTHYYNEFGPSDMVVKKLSSDSEAAYANALRYYATGDEGYARTGVAIIKAWATTLESVQNNHEESRLTMSNLWPSMIWGAEILKATYPNWSSEMGSAEADFEDLLRTVVWNNTSPTCTVNCHPYAFTAPTQNHGAWGTTARMAIAIYLNDRTRYNQAVTEYQVIMPGYIERNNSNPDKVDGYAIETCRSGGDLWHTQMAFAPFTATSEMAWKQGLDLYSFDSHKLKLGIDYHAQYIGWKEGRYDADPVLKQQIKDNWPCPRTGGINGPPLELDDPANDTDWWTFYEMSYNHYNGRLNMPATEIASVINTVPGYRPEDYSATLGYGSYTHVKTPGSGGSTPVPPKTETAKNLKVAFIGDSGLGSGFQSVLNLIKSEGADMVLHQGDFAYVVGPTEPRSWESDIITVLGKDFPYFFSVGNHDTDDWSITDGYQTILNERIAASSADINCTGSDPGVELACEYKGLFFILSGVGTLGSGHDGYIDGELNNSNNIWKVCTWHKNHNTLQVGGKTTEVQTSTYDICRNHGAIIATGHEHSYSRTKTINNFGSLSVDSGPDPRTEVDVIPGKTFAFVNGLGGRAPRNQQRCTPSTYPYGCNEWASIYTSDQGAQSGVLFIEFNVDNDPYKARGYFKNVAGAIIDPDPSTGASYFTINAGSGSSVPPTSPPPTSPPGTSPPPGGGGVPGAGSGTPDLNADGRVDYVDLGILMGQWGTGGATPPPPPPPLNQCEDGIDNDSDGLIDLNDPGCTGSSDNDETDPVTTPPTGTDLNAASCSSVDIQASIDIATTGDTVVLPVCDVLFEGQVTIPSGVNIRGAGAANTILRKTKTISSNPMIVYNCNTRDGFDYSGITLEGVDTATDPLFTDTGLALGIANSTNSNACENFRIHDAAFNSFGRAGIAVWGGNKGVIDHNTFDNKFQSPVTGLNLGYGIEIYGNADWPTLDLGSENAVFVEDNTFTRTRHAVTSNNGSQYVFRYNTINEHYNEGAPIDAHGKTAWPTGSRSYEIYNNTISNTALFNGAVWIRGGDGVIYDNTYNGPLNNTLSLSNDDGGNSCAIGACQHITKSLYLWNNAYQGAIVQGFNDVVGAYNATPPEPTKITLRHGNTIAEGADFYSDNRQLPGYLPYTYPHPLVSGAVAPPPVATGKTIKVGTGNYPNLTVNESNGDIHIAYGTPAGLQYVVYNSVLSEPAATNYAIGATDIDMVGTNYNHIYDIADNRPDCRVTAEVPGTPCIHLGSGSLDIELDSNNRPHIAVWNNWVEWGPVGATLAEPATQAVYYTRNTNGINWSPLERVSKPVPNPEPVSLMGMDIQNDNTVHIIYYHNDDATPTVASYRGGIKTQSVQPSPAFQSEAPNTNSAIATANGVDWVLKYREGPGFDRFPHLAKLTGTTGSGTGGSITSTERIHAAPVFSNMGDHTGLDKDVLGAYHAVWTWGHGGGEIWYAKRSLAGSWVNQKQIASGTTNDFANIAVADNGMIAVVWMDQADERLRYSLSIDGSTWSAPSFVHTASSASNFAKFGDTGPIVASGNDFFISYWVKTGRNYEGDVYLRKIPATLASNNTVRFAESDQRVLGATTANKKARITRNFIFSFLAASVGFSLVLFIVVRERSKKSKKPKK